MWPPHFLMNFGNSSYSVTYRNICRDFATNLSTNRDEQHYEFRTIKILTCQYLVPLVSLMLPLFLSVVEIESVIVTTAPYFEQTVPLTYSLCFFGKKSNYPNLSSYLKLV